MTTPLDELDEDELRYQVAARIRKLSHSLVGRASSPKALRLLISAIDQLLPTIEASPAAQPPPPITTDPELLAAIAAGGFGALLDRGHNPVFGHTVVSGRANPMGIAAEFRRQDKTVIADVVLGRAFEGAPGRAHGGIVSAILDETMGAAAALGGHLAYTASLTVTFRASTPIEVPLEFHAWETGREGRKVFIRGEGRHENKVLTEAEGLFINAPELTSPQAP